MLAKIGEQLAISIELLLKPDAVLGVESCLLLLDHLLRVRHGLRVPLGLCGRRRTVRRRRPDAY